MGAVLALIGILSYLMAFAWLLEAAGLVRRRVPARRRAQGFAMSRRRETTR
jgi:hypothetical protein